MTCDCGLFGFAFLLCLWFFVVASCWGWTFSNSISKFLSQILCNFPSEISAGSYGSTGIMMPNECKDRHNTVLVFTK